MASVHKRNQQKQDLSHSPSLPNSKPSFQLKQKQSDCVAHFFSFLSAFKSALRDLSNSLITTITACTKSVLYFMGCYRYQPPLEVSVIQQLTSKQQSNLARDPRFDWKALSEEAQEAYIHTLSPSLLAQLVRNGFSPADSLWKPLILKLQQHPHAQVILPKNCFPKTKEAIDSLPSSCVHDLAMTKTAAQWNALPDEAQNDYILKMDPRTLNLVVKRGFSPRNKGTMHNLVEKLRKVNPFNELLPKTYFPQEEQAINKLSNQEINSILYGPLCQRHSSSIDISRWNNLPAKSQLVYLRKIGTSERVLDLLFAGFTPKEAAKTQFIQVIQTIRDRYDWMCDNQEDDIDAALAML